MMSRDFPLLLQIQFLQAPPAGYPSEVEFVGGPLPGRQPAPDPGLTIVTLPGGDYVRSVRCADDGAVRFVWRPVTPVVGDASGAVK